MDLYNRKITILTPNDPKIEDKKQPIRLKNPLSKLSTPKKFKKKVKHIDDNNSDNFEIIQKNRDNINRISRTTGQAPVSNQALNLNKRSNLIKKISEKKALDNSKNIPYVPPQVFVPNSDKPKTEPFEIKKFTKNKIKKEENNKVLEPVSYKKELEDDGILDLQEDNKIDEKEIIIPEPKPIKPNIKTKTEWNKEYKIYWVVIDANKIINLCSPHAIFTPKNWSNEELEYRQKVADVYINSWNNQKGFFTRLEKSIEEDGFRNPILITAGKPRIRNISEIPPEMRNLPEKEMLICEILGGSRLHYAQNNGLAIPCLVTDWVGRFSNQQELTDVASIKECFMDPPDIIYFTDQGLRTSSPKHVHLPVTDRDPRELGRIRGDIVNKVSLLSRKLVDIDE